MHAKPGEIIEERYEDHFPESLERLKADNGGYFIQMDMKGGV